MSKSSLRSERYKSVERNIALLDDATGRLSPRSFAVHCRSDVLQQTLGLSSACRSFVLLLALRRTQIPVRNARSLVPSGSLSRLFLARRRLLAVDRRSSSLLSMFASSQRVAVVRSSFVARRRSPRLRKDHSRTISSLSRDVASLLQMNKSRRPNLVFCSFLVLGNVDVRAVAR